MLHSFDISKKMNFQTALNILFPFLMLLNMSSNLAYGYVLFNGSICIEFFRKVSHQRE